MSVAQIVLSDTVLQVLLCLAAVSLLLLYVLRYRFYKLPARYAAWQTEAEEIETATHSAMYSSTGTYPFVSIVVPVYNQAETLDVLLPCLFGQPYRGSFEIIVVDQISTDNTVEIIKRYRQANEHLRFTHVPPTSRNIELRKLAITLGVKAAHGEWVIVLSPDTSPLADTWLSYYAQSLTDDVDWVEAYYNYSDDGSLTARRAVLESVLQFATYLRAYEAGRVLGCNSSNWAVRRSWFLEQEGFSDSLCLPFGEEDIFAARHAVAERTTFLCSPETKLTETLPSAAHLRVQRALRAETRRHLGRAARTAFWQDAWASFFFYLFVAVQAVYTLYRLFQDGRYGQYSLAHLYEDIACLVLWVAVFVLPVLLLRRSLRALGERSFGVYLFFFDLLRPWRTLQTEFRRYVRKPQFHRKFI